MLLYIGVAAVAVGLAVCCAVLVIGQPKTTGVAHSLALIEQGAPRRQEVARNELGFADRLARPILDFGRRLAVMLSPGGTAARLTRLLDFAGNPRTWTVERVFAVKGVGLLIGVAMGLLFGHLSLLGFLLAAAFGAAGFWLADLLLYNIGLHRQEELRLGLADALDMLVVCMQAGQGFDSALQQVARSVTGPVAGEFSRVLQEISIGRSRADAFGSLGERTSVEEVKTFITALVQADRLGLPIGDVIHEQAKQMRLVRRQLAEEKAQKVPVKIMVPMVLCIFPLLFIIVIGPGAIRIMETFSQF